MGGIHNLNSIRNDFPILKTTVNGKILTYLDSTATSLKPRQVVDAIDGYYNRYSANVFRGIYPISEQATEAYEGARETVAAFIHAASSSEVVFTRNTSESLNLVAYGWAIPNLKAGDGVVSTIMEHHSNFVPWQQIAGERGLDFRVLMIDGNGEFNLGDVDKLVTPKTKLFAVTALSNVLGTVNPVGKIVKAVKRRNPKCLVVVDGAQWVPHLATDVRAWGADFVAFSGHKMLGPTGIGVLWGRYELLEAMRPFLFGGEMIREVHVKNTLFKDPPHKFEAGTPHIAGAIGLGAAVTYLQGIGMDRIRAHEEEITGYALKKLQGIDGLTVYGPRDPGKRGGVIAFNLRGIHAHDAAQILADENICVRAGSHCAMPLHECLGTAATLRASFYIYSSRADVDRLAEGLRLTQKTFT